MIDAGLLFLCVSSFIFLNISLNVLVTMYRIETALKDWLTFYLNKKEFMKQLIAIFFLQLKGNEHLKCIGFLGLEDNGTFFWIVGNSKEIILHFRKPS